MNLENRESLYVFSLLIFTISVIPLVYMQIHKRMMNFAMTEQEKKEHSTEPNHKVTALFIILFIGSSVSLYTNFYKIKTPSPDGVQLVTYNYFKKTLTVYPNKTEELTYNLGFGTHPDCFWSEDGSRLAINDKSAQCYIYDNSHSDLRIHTIDPSVLCVYLDLTLEEIEYHNSYLEIYSFPEQNHVSILYSISSPSTEKLFSGTYLYDYTTRELKEWTQTS